MKNVFSMDRRLAYRRWFRENRLKLFYASLLLSSFLSLYSTQGFFNLFFYALLAMVIVRMDEEKYDSLHLPRTEEIIVGLLVCASSFIFDFATRGIFGGGYGQTDYTILVIGIILLFFGYRNIKKIYLPILLVGGLSFSLKALQLVYDNHFEAVAEWFVAAITGIAGPGGLGYPVYGGAIATGTTLAPGSITTANLAIDPGTFTVFGVNEVASLHVAWGCTGLRSLVMFSFILVALIYPLNTTPRKKMLGIAIGILGAFIINILRMVMLAMIMYYKDLKTTLDVHLHLGDFLFIVWMAAYWWLFFHFFVEDDEEEESDDESSETEEAEENVVEAILLEQSEPPPAKA